MKKMRTPITALLLLTAIIARAQTGSGLRFETNLTWDQVLAKAKSEHKYIFVDCYATWCGPCKAMDANVYPLKDVGDAYNNKFINVRLQMDKTDHDGGAVKGWYQTAARFATDYNVNSYPTFLFFDENGNPVHKEVGRLNEESFITLAADAKNIKKQYYHILKYFKAEQLDTNEEKELANSLYFTDQNLAGKIAADYLSRIPQAQLGQQVNLQLMEHFQADTVIQQLALLYEKKLNRDQLTQKNNLDFIVAMKKQPAIEEIAVQFISTFNENDLNTPRNKDFISRFSDDVHVKKLIKKYIDSLPEGNLYGKQSIEYMDIFSDTVTDRGFIFFYHHPDKVDSVMKDKEYAEGDVRYIINNEEFKPEFDKAKATGSAPNFEAISIIITDKYNKSYAERIILDGKIAWYKYLAISKKDEKYWPELINYTIDQIRFTRYDTVKRESSSIDDFCWLYIFQHCYNQAQMEQAIQWMAEIVERTPEADRNFENYVDTYAAILYKSGKSNEALKWENKALSVATAKKNTSGADLFTSMIEKMKRGEKTWLDKAYISN